MHTHAKIVALKEERATTAKAKLSTKAALEDSTVQAQIVFSICGLAWMALFAQIAKGAWGEIYIFSLEVGRFWPAVYALLPLWGMWRVLDVIYRQDAAKLRIVRLGEQIYKLEQELLGHRAMVIEKNKLYSQLDLQLSTMERQLAGCHEHEPMVRQLRMQRLLFEDHITNVIQQLEIQRWLDSQASLTAAWELVDGCDVRVANKSLEELSQLMEQLTKQGQLALPLQEG